VTLASALELDRKRRRRRIVIDIDGHDP